MNFDRIAPFYGPMERWLAGKCLHRCRTAFLGEIPVPRRVLMVGEGHGRFLGAFRERFPEADITVLDGSAKMLEISKARLADHRGVEFVHAMVEDWETEQRYDLIVTNFLLDCLPEATLERVIDQLASFAEPDADWLVAEFHIPEEGFSKWRSRIIVGLLYFFFRVVAGLEARQLHPPDAALERNGFARIRRKEWSWRLLKSEWWRRGVGEARESSSG